MNQLTKTERQEIYLLKEKGYSLRSIGKALGRNASTISREIRRNSVKQEYVPKKAQMKFYLRWKYRKPYIKKIRENDELERYIITRLKEGWSPEQIAGRWNRENNDTVTYSSVYRYLHSQFGRKYKKLLPYKGRKRKKGARKGQKVLIPQRTWIDERPEVVNHRKRFGDFEGDTIVSRRGDTTSFVSLIERKSRYLFAYKVPNKKSDQMQQTILSLTKNIPVQTMTFDNGVEFAHHYKLPYDTYFCRPYSSWQKGQIEYANRLIRRFFPKRTLLKNISLQQLQSAINTINNTPRKCLNFKTPQEVFLELLHNPP